MTVSMLGRVSRAVAAGVCVAAGGAASAMPFTTVVTVDAASGPLGDNFTVGTDTQLNVEATGVVGFSLAAGEPDVFLYDDDGNFVGVTPGTTSNAEVNIRGGFVDAFMSVNRGATVNFLAGTVGSAGGSASSVNDGGVLNMSGGTMRDGFNVAAGGLLNLSGGQIDGPSSMQASTLNMTGGTLGPSFDIGGDDFATVAAVANVSGGELGANLEVFSDGVLNLLGSGFSVNGVPVAITTQGVAQEVMDRGLGTTLTGTLADGTAFSLDLTPGFDSSNPANDGFYAGSTLTVTLVPEPASLALLGLGGLLLVGRRRG